MLGYMQKGRDSEMKKEGKMTTVEMMSKVECKLQSVTGYSYNPDTLRKTLEAGYAAIPAGAVLATNGGQTLKLISNCVTCWANGQQTKTTPVEDDNMRDTVLMMYAGAVCQTGIHMGAM